MPEILSKNARIVQDALISLGLDCQVIEMTNTTRSASEAADAVGCHVGQIVKSLIFMGQQSRNPYLVVASGVNRVNEKRLADFTGEPVKMPDADFVKQKTGFVIGGVPPLGHRSKLQTFIDADLLNYEEIWAAAGSPNALFKLTPKELQLMTRGQVVSIK
jgi:Cys-tRNA(Pro) deacylase